MALSSTGRTTEQWIAGGDFADDVPDEYRFIHLIVAKPINDVNRDAMCLRFQAEGFLGLQAQRFFELQSDDMPNELRLLHLIVTVLINDVARDATCLRFKAEFFLSLPAQRFTRV